MRAIFALIVIIVLAFIGYEYVYKGNPAPRSVDQAVQQARDAANEAADAARTAAQSARQQLGPAAQQAEQALQQGAEKLKQGAEELGQKAQQAASGAADKTRETVGKATTAGQPQGPMVVDGVDLGTATREAVGRARAALATATDQPTAEAQLPTLKSVNDKLREIQGKLDRLSTEGKRDFARLVAQETPELRNLADRTKGIKGVGPDVASTLDQILGKLDGWAHAQT